MIFLCLALLVGTFLASSPECPTLLPLTKNSWEVTYPPNEWSEVFCPGYIIPMSCSYDPPIPNSPYLQLVLGLPGNLTVKTDFPQHRLIEQIQLTFVSCFPDRNPKWIQNSTLEIYLNADQLVGTIGCDHNSGAYTNRSIILQPNVLAESLALILTSNEVPLGMTSLISIGQIMLF